MEGSFQGVAEAMSVEITTHEDGSRSGLSPVIWKAWETTGVNVSFELSSSEYNSRGNRQGTRQEFRHERKKPRIVVYQDHSELKKLVPRQLTVQLLVQLVLISIKEDRVHRQL